MRRVSWATYLWPGLPQLWQCGFVSGLVLAVGFGVVLNLLLLASLVWVELLEPAHLRLGWLAVGCLWVTSMGLSAWVGKPGVLPPSQAVTAEGLFRQALSEYLQQSWFEAERVLVRLLKLCPRDVEARLLLATLLRRTGRHSEAAGQLARLERLEDSQKWSSEIARENQLLARANEVPILGSAAEDLNSPAAAAVAAESRRAA